MTIIESLQDIVVQYNRLSAYCNEFFQKIRQRYPEHIACSPGCSDCCRLESVLPLEAYHIRLALSKQPHVLKKLARPSKRLFCPFLYNQQCAIYAVRPLICRTHGLLLYYPETNQIDCCPENFRGDDLEIDQDDLFDIQNSTEELVKLNLNYVRLTDQQQRVDQRILLQTIKEELLATVDTEQMEE